MQGDVDGLARDDVAEGTQLLIVLGGDGTLLVGGTRASPAATFRSSRSTSAGSAS